MKYTFWYGTGTHERERILQHGLTPESKLTARADGDLYARGGFKAFRRIDKAIVVANERQNNSLPMLVRIVMDDNGLLQTGPDVSSVYFPVSDPDKLTEVFARVAMLMRMYSENSAPPALIEGLPHYEDIVQSIVFSFGISDKSDLKPYSKVVLDVYLTSLMRSVVGMLGWEDEVRDRLNNLDPATNWIAQSQNKKYLYQFPTPLAARIDLPSKLTQQLKSLFSFFTEKLGSDILTFPASVGEPGGRQKSRIDFMFSIDAITQNLKKGNGKTPDLFIDRYFMTLLFGPVTAEFVRQWTAEVGPYENIAWEDNRAVNS